MLRRGVIVAVLLVAGCGGDGAESGRDPGCEIWADLLIAQDEGGGVSDAEAARRVRQIEEVTRDDEVRRFATALAARLEDGVDISTSFQGLGRACGLVD